MTEKVKEAPQRKSPSLLLGDLKDFQERPFHLLLDIAHNYEPVTRIRFGPVPQYVITHPDGAQHVFQRNNRNYIKEQQFMNISRLALKSGDDLFTSDGQEWLQRRRLMQPAFHRRVINQFGDIIVEEAERMLSGWQEGQPLDLEQVMMDVTMGIIGRTMLSEDILEHHPQLYHAFNTISTYIVQRATRLSNRLVPPALPTPANRAFREALATVRQVLGRVVAQRQAQPEEERPHDLLTMMMAARDDESGYALSEEQLIDELFGIVSAGHETSSITLAWLFHSLAQNPDAERKLHEEVDRVLQGRQPTVEDLPNLPYVEQVVNETMRRYPAAYLTTRQSIDADEILGYTIPANAMIIINIYGLHHHPAYWEEPQQFKPERFAPENAGNIGKYLYIPFGEGPRKCIGEPLARLEMCLIVALVAQHFCLRQDSTRPAELIARFTLGARDGIWMIPERR